MIWTIIVVLAVLWILGLITANIFGGLIHILLVVAIVLMIVNLITGRRGTSL